MKCNGCNLISCKCPTCINLFFSRVTGICLCYKESSGCFRSSCNLYEEDWVRLIRMRKK